MGCSLGDRTGGAAFTGRLSSLLAAVLFFPSRKPCPDPAEVACPAPSTALKAKGFVEARCPESCRGTEGGSELDSTIARATGGSTSASGTSPSIAGGADGTAETGAGIATAAG